MGNIDNNLGKLLRKSVARVGGCHVHMLSADAWIDGARVLSLEEKRKQSIKNNNNNNMDVCGKAYCVCVRVCVWRGSTFLGLSINEEERRAFV